MAGTGQPSVKYRLLLYIIINKEQGGDLLQKTVGVGVGHGGCTAL